MTSATSLASTTDQLLTAPELHQARKYLEQTRRSFLASVQGLTPEQWYFKPAPDRWSAAGILEHCVIVQEHVLGPVSDQLAASPFRGNPDMEEVDAFIPGRFPDRTQRFPAPEMVHPIGRWTPTEALERLNRNYDQFLANLQSARGLRQHIIESRPLQALSNGRLQYMDGYQWILAGAAHVQRHMAQILEVKADPKYPHA